MNSVTAAEAGAAATQRVQRHAMPAWIYSHPELARLEHERILRPSWQIVCHVNSIPKAGDFVTLEMGPDSVVVIRDKEGQIQAFHNVCRHRGARMLDGAGKCQGTITCPYHGWSYRFDGGLIGVPSKETFADLDRNALGLLPVRTDTFLGFVFVCLAGNPPSPREMFGPLAEEFAPYRLEECQPLSAITTEVWNVDWKLAMDNYLESYHVPIGHPGLARMFTPDYEDQRGVPGVARGISWLKEQKSSRWAERMYTKHIADVATHLPEENRRCWRFYSMLPNLGIDLFPDQVDFFQVLPGGPGRTIIRGATFALPDDRREMRLMRYLGSRLNTQVNAEDRWLCERVAQGLRSPTYTPGPLSDLEAWMGEFHELLRARIPETRLPSPPAHFA